MRRWIAAALVFLATPAAAQNLTTGNFGNFINSSASATSPCGATDYVPMIRGATTFRLPCVAFPPFTSKLLRILATADASWQTTFGDVTGVVASEGATNNFVGYAYNNLAPNTFALPVGTIGYGKLPVASTGNQVFGLYGLGEIYAHNGSAIGGEITVRNNSDQDGAVAPLNCPIGISYICAVGLNVTSGGLRPSSVGIQVADEAGSTVGFDTGIYIKDYGSQGVFVDSTSSGTPYAALLKSNPSSINMQLQTVGAQVKANSVLTIVNGATTNAGLKQDGSLVINGAGGRQFTFGPDAAGNNQIINSDSGGDIDLQINGTTRFSISGSTAAATATGVINGQAGFQNNGVLFVSQTAPTIASGGCTTGSAQSISQSNGTAAFEITLGGATCGSTIVLTLPTAAHGWVCDAHDITTPAGNVVEQSAGGSATSVTLTNYVRTTGVAGNFTGADKLAVKCAAY